MKRYAISNVAMTGPNFSSLKTLPPHVGVEIFYEWGGRRFYEYALKEIMRDRIGSFSIHAPFQYIDFSEPCDEKALFAYLCEPFELYHMFHADAYVIHTDATKKEPYSPQEVEDRIRRVEDRLCRFQQIAAAEGVELLVENLCVGRAGNHLFSQERFLQLFARHPQLNCLIDIGHAHAQGFELEKVIGFLGERIKAYHLHDNNGMYDSHLPVFKGSIDWERFASLVTMHTPQAHMVLEYASAEGIEGFVNDIRRLEALFEAKAQGT